jgi:hypothetical protein
VANNNDYSTFVFKDTIYPLIKTNLGNKNNERTLLTYISRYIDKNHDTLFTASLSQLYWNTGKNEDTNILYNLTKTDEKMITKAIKDSKQTKSSWKHYNKPYLWLLVGMIKFFYDAGKTKEMQMVILDLSFAIYATKFYTYWQYPPNKNIMDYTVNNLSNRYDLKKLGSIIKVLQKISFNCHDKYADYLKDNNFCDRRIVEYIQNLFTRINNMLQEIAKQYYKNKDSGKYLNYNQDDNSAENFHENDNISYKIENLANKVTNKILTSGMNPQIAEASAKLAGVSILSIKETVDKVIEKEDNEIKEFVSLFLQQYLVIDKHPMETISSKNYITYINKIYSKSNTSDKGIIRIKELLDKWLNDNCEKYKRTQRTATLIAFRKAIYYFFTLSTQAVIMNKY